MAVNDILLGDGIFQINGTTIGLTRGGGQFVIERENRVIEADGDFGPVKGRVRKIGSIAKLTVNALELSSSNLNNFFPATVTSINTDSDISESNTTILSAMADIANGEYVDVAWIGKTKGGSAVKISVYNALNMENLDLSLVDKEEVVATITFTATYDETTRTTEPWEIEYA